MFSECVSEYFSFNILNSRGTMEMHSKKYFIPTAISIIE